MRLVIGEPDAAAHVLDKTLHHGQSQSGAALAAGSERADAIVQYIIRKAMAVVDDLNMESLFILVGSDTYHAGIAFQCLGRVQNQIQQSLTQCALGQLHRQRAERIDFQAHVFSNLVARQGDQIAD